jgi:signal peptidase I
VKINHKDPWLAVNLSMFFPGIGQVYAGNLSKGIAFFATQIGLLAIAFWSLFNADGNTVTGAIELGIAAIVYLVNILDAHLCVYRQREHEIPEKIPRKHKNAWFAVFVSRILPGLGQIYTNKSISGLLFLVSTLFLLKLDDYFSALLVIPPLLTASATYHAYITFPQRHKSSYRSLVAAMAGLVFLGGMAWSYIPPWLNQRMFLIPSESMVPTLQKGDRIFVSKFHDYLPQTGDIVVFKPSEAIKTLDDDPSDNLENVYYVKRVIGKPGESIRIDNGIVYINDRALKEDYIASPPDYQWGPQVVPSNSYLLLGDNRNDSFDSHIWGFLPKNYLFGKAYKIYWPPKRVRSLLSWEKTDNGY